MPTDIIAALEARGLIQDIAGRDELAALLAAGSVPFYAGYDPSAPSLHFGNLVPMAIMVRLQEAGHKPLVVVGGATGMVGDPSGKSDERNLLDRDTLAANVAIFRRQLEPFLHFGDGPSDAVMLDNLDWFAPIGYLDFLREVGKYITINYMTAKESVKARLASEQGISYTEFSYMLLQGYDFVHLAQAYGCRLQLGGADQWGNITCGIELQRKLGRPPLYGITAPLLLDAQGQKMGKTSSGTRLWLDPERTSPYAFYQYWLNTDDADVERLLKIFSRRPLEEIADIARAHAEHPERREGQRLLAEDVTTWLHGADAVRRAAAASKVLFGGEVADLRDADLRPLLADVPSSALSRDELAAGLPLLDLLVRTHLVASKGAGRRLLEQGGVYVNNVRVSELERVVSTSDLATESMLILRAGKKSYHILRAE